MGWNNSKQWQTATCPTLYFSITISLRRYHLLKQNQQYWIKREPCIDHLNILQPFHPESFFSSLHLLFKTRVIVVHHNLSSMVVARGKWGMVVEVIFRRLKRIGSSVVQKCCLSHRPTIRRWWLSACMLSLASFLFCAYYITHVQLNRWGFLSFSFSFFFFLTVTKYLFRLVQLTW